MATDSTSPSTTEEETVPVDANEDQKNQESENEKDSDNEKDKESEEAKPIKKPPLIALKSALRTSSQSQSQKNKSSKPEIKRTVSFIPVCDDNLFYTI